MLDSLLDQVKRLRSEQFDAPWGGCTLGLVKVTMLYFDDCPSWQIADSHLRLLAEEIDYSIERIEVTTPEQAEQLRFRGSPSIHIDGSDLFAASDAPVGLSCRIYQTPGGPAGSPTESQLRAALMRRRDIRAG